MDHLLVPDFVWEFTGPCRLYLPRVGDVLITLDVNNVAETSFWNERRPPSYTAIRSAWIVVVETLPSNKTGSAGLDPAWATAGFRLLSIYEEAEGGSWTMVDTVPVQMSSLLAPPGLGHGNTTEPSEENVLIVLHPNNFPPSAPVLQAGWWRVRYASRCMTNSWILGVLDVPQTSGSLTRTLSCWIRGRSGNWTRDGTSQSYTVAAVQRNSSNQVELETLPMKVSSTGVPSVTTCNSPSTMESATHDNTV
jgi:hypothetical protein